MELTKATAAADLIATRQTQMGAIARHAYEAYAATTANKNFQGGTMPTWDKLPEAIVNAWIAATQASLFMFASQFLDGDLGCFGKAIAKGEPTFTLRAQDQRAADTIMSWIVLNPGAPAAKLEEARTIAEAMRQWPNKKAAD